MTHDELLAKVSHGYRWTCNNDREPWDALRAVVELHQPSLLVYHNSDFPRMIVCGQCNKIYGSDEDKPYGYPCSTIQAIEKELG